MKIDKYNIYDKLVTNLQELANKYWLSNDETKFADLHKFEEKLDDQLYGTKKNLLQSGKEKKTYEPVKKEISTENIINNSDLAFSFISNYMDFVNDKSSPLT